MGSKRKLAVVPSRQADPLRAQLAAAIKKAQVARERLSAHGQAIERARQQVTVAETELEAVRVDAAAVKAAYAEQLAQAVTDGAPLPVSSSAVRNADAKVLDATNAVSAIHIARDQLKESLHPAEVDVVVADADVIIAVNALLAPEIERLVVRAEAASQALIGGCAVLDYLRRMNLTGAGSNASDREIDDAAFPWSEREAVQRAKQVIPTELEERARSLSESYRGTQFNLPPDVLQLVAAWREARARLRAAADAALPPLPGETETPVGGEPAG
jgi:hypothetical protein